MSELDDLMAKVPILSREDRAKLRAAMSALDGATATATVEDSKKLDTDAQVVWDVLSAELHAMGIHCPPLGVFKRTRDYSTFLKAVPVVAAFVRQGFRVKTRASFRRAVRIGVRVVIRTVGKYDRVTLCLRSVVGNLQRMDGMVEHQFPGYRESGLLPILLRPSKR